MLTELTNIMDELSIEEAERLLESNIVFEMDRVVAARVRSRVMQKAGLKKSRFFSSYSQLMLLASVVLCVILSAGGIGGYYVYSKPIAYIDIDINPSIELSINRWQKIVSAKGYNSEGENILEAVSVRHKDVTEGVTEIINTASLHGFLEDAEEAAISIAVISDDTQKAEQLIEVSKEAVEDYISAQEARIEILTDYINTKQRELAEEIGITAGKLNLIYKLQALEGEAAIEAYKDYSVKEILKQIKVLRKDETDKQQVKAQTGYLASENIAAEADSSKNQKEDKKEDKKDSSQSKAGAEEKGINSKESSKEENTSKENAKNELKDKQKATAPTLAKNAGTKDDKELAKKDKMQKNEETDSKSTIKKDDSNTVISNKEDNNRETDNKKADNKQDKESDSKENVPGNKKDSNIQSEKPKK